MTLTPINLRRWRNFKNNRRGYWSLVIFLGLFGITLFAEFIANDRPLVMSYKGELLSPVLFDYTGAKFGVPFYARVPYRDPEIIRDIEANGWMLWPPIRYSYDTENKEYPGRMGPKGCLTGFPAPPQWATSKLCDDTPERLALFTSVWNWNWLGMDDAGRDVLARVIYGFRICVLFGLILTFFSTIVGVAAGAVQGYFGGLTDLIFQRIIEIWSSLPYLMVMLIIASILVPGFWTLLIALLFFRWTSMVSVVRAEFLRARNQEYITAARALGLSDTRIMWKHMLPNAMVATLTFLPLNLTGGISAITALDFLGLGMPPGSPSFGELLLQGRKYLEAPWLGLSGFFALSILLSLLIFIGEGARDALDPRKTFR